MSTTEITRQSTTPKSAFADAESFALAQRMGNALATAAIFPTKFKDPGSCVIIINMAWRLGMDPIEVAQNIDLIHGNPTWKSAYVISKISTSPQWSTFDYEVTTEGKVKTPSGKEIDNKVCRVIATRAKDGKVIEGNPVSYAMAIAEGWWARKDSKWPNMPEQMLQYRAASFFNRINPTAELLGIRSEDEAQDIPFEEVTDQQPSTPTITPPPTQRKPSKKTSTQIEDAVIETQQPKEQVTQKPQVVTFGDIVGLLHIDNRATTSNGNPLPDGDYTDNDDPTSIWEISDGIATKVSLM